VTLPRHYAKHLVPRLERLAAAEAYCVVAGVETFDGGYCALMAYSLKYGAAYLPDDELDDLEEWLCSMLVEEIERQELIA
jgi:hypothetical protein